MTFVDTSAIYASVSESDPHHADAARVIRDLISSGTGLTHNYVVLETAAITQQRRGIEAARRVLTELVPAFHTIWVDAELHEAGVSTLLSANRRQLSLVDCVSFAVMRRERIETAFAFDGDFEREGFRVVPA